MMTNAEAEEFFLEQDRRMDISDQDSDEYLAHVLSQNLPRNRPVSPANSSFSNATGKGQEHASTRSSSRDPTPQNQSDGSFKREQGDQDAFAPETVLVEKKRKHRKLTNNSNNSEITHPVAPASESSENFPQRYDSVTLLNATSDEQSTVVIREVSPARVNRGQPATPDVAQIQQQTGKCQTEVKILVHPEGATQRASGNSKRSSDQVETLAIKKRPIRPQRVDIAASITATGDHQPQSSPISTSTFQQGFQRKEGSISAMRARSNHHTDEQKRHRMSTGCDRQVENSDLPQVKFSPTEDSVEAIDSTCDRTSLPPFRQEKSRSDQSLLPFPEDKGKSSSHSSPRRWDGVVKTPAGNSDVNNTLVSGNSTLVIEDASPPPLETSAASLSRTEPQSQNYPVNTRTVIALENPKSIVPKPSSSSATAQPPRHKRPLIDSEPSLRKEKKPAKAKVKLKPQLMTPCEYALKLQETPPAGGKPNSVKCLKGKNIFYIGGDMQYAGARTRGRMDLIVKHGGTLLPTYDPLVVSHIVTDAQRGPTVRALGIQKLQDIPNHIPTVTWSWVLSGLKRTGRKSKESEDEEVRMDDVCMHAAFLERFDAGRVDIPSTRKAKQKDKGKVKESSANDSDESSQIYESTQEEPPQHPQSAASTTAAESVSHTATSSLITLPRDFHSEDPLAEFYALARTKCENAWPNHEGEDTDAGSSDGESDHQIIEMVRQPVQKRGFTCDKKEAQMSHCVNQDVVDKLEELMELHKSKPSDEDRWRAFGYGKCLRALRNYPKRIKSFAEARSIRGVGEKTALKIMEIIRTGELRRIGYEKTDDVEAVHIFQGIYGVGRLTAFKWYASGCRTLDDVKARKGGIKLTACQEIGVKFYDDLNSRMPRSEAEAVFNCIKPRALALDPKLFIDIMGSFRRGKADCGDIDILITRPVDDGKTHAGILKTLLRDLHSIGLLTEDLSLPEDWENTEACYRGLCRLPGKGSRRRRIDILTVPWVSRGAALLYYTGDDIFNRAIRYKAGVMGYSLNQRGLYGGVVRDPRNRRVKVNEGTIIASEREEEIFKILGVPWQEPHERVRG